MSFLFMYLFIYFLTFFLDTSMKYRVRQNNVQDIKLLCLTEYLQQKYFIQHLERLRQITTSAF